MMRMSHQVDTNGKWLQFVYLLPSFLCVTLFSLSQNAAKLRNSNKPWPNFSSSEGSQDTSVRQISGHYWHAFSRKCRNHKFKLFHWGKMPPKLVKSTDRDQNLIRRPGYISIPYFRPFPHAFSRKCLKSLHLNRFTKFLGLCYLEIWYMTLKIRKPQAVGDKIPR